MIEQRKTLYGRIRLGEVTEEQFQKIVQQLQWRSYQKGKNKTMEKILRSQDQGGQYYGERERKPQAQDE